MRPPDWLLTDTLTDIMKPKQPEAVEKEETLWHSEHSKGSVDSDADSELLPEPKYPLASASASAKSPPAWALAILLLALGFTIFNSFQLSSLQPGNALTGASTASVSSPLPEIIPQGIPVRYGVELGISFDSVTATNPQATEATINRLGLLDQQITLNEAQKKRYINVLYTLEGGFSCEYCCGAKSIINPNGEPACGCAHSYAMRGLAKYLLTKHASEYTDAQILEELGKWKTLFFPGAIQAKAQILQQKGIELTYINLASNKYRGIEQGASSDNSMVGGC